MGTYTGVDKRLQYLFQNGGGGGGTTVIANPAGQASADLEKLQVENTIYAIPSAFIDIGDCYSTTEIQIGCWIDGRPLYGRVISGLNQSIQSERWVTLNNVNIPNGKDLIRGVCYGEYSEQYILGIGKIHLDSTTGNVEIRNVDDVVTITAIYLEYTKSTDVAGSGIYVPSGSYAFHYTTEEQIIGTFLGETVYGKVIQPNYAVSGTAWQTLPTTIANGKDLITMKCWDYSTEYFLFEVEIKRINSATGQIIIKPTSSVNGRTIKYAYIEYTKTQTP